MEGGLLVLLSTKRMLVGDETHSWDHLHRLHMVVDNLLLPLHDRVYPAQARHTAVCPAPCSSQQDPMNSEL